MTSLTFAQITKGVRDTLGRAEGIKRDQSGADLTESIPDTPLLQVYFEGEDTAPPGQTDRTTFKAGVRVSHITIHTDVYVRQRNNIDQDIASCETVAEAVRVVLAQQDTKPYFNLDGLKTYRWRAQRVTFVYGAVEYSGIRFIIEVWVY